jgi:hypothetical protein
MNKTTQTKILYSDSSGNAEIRTIIPKTLLFGISLLYPEGQWLLNAFDVEAGSDITFAMKNILSWWTPSVPTKLPEPGIVKKTALKKPSCKFDLAWTGRCTFPVATANGMCTAHSKSKCSKCGGQAVRECKTANCNKVLCSRCLCHLYWATPF